jgi:hypothetical protein
MKRFILLFAIAGLATSCHAQQSIKDVEWLVGKWNRTNMKPGRSGEEKWKKISDTELVGKGFNLKGTDTLFVEKMNIILKDHQLYYVADVPENKEPVPFKFTSVTANGFVCENPQHDFPKMISYQRQGKSLKATISGDGKQMDYLFELVE